MSKVNDDEAGNIHLHVYFPANKEGIEPQIGGGRLFQEKKEYPKVSGHTHEHLVKDGNNIMWLVVTGGHNDLVGSLILHEGLMLF